MKVLIIEDKATLADAIREYLKMKNIDASVCYEGLSGYAQAKKGSFDIIVLDLMLPNKDGVSIIKDLRKFGVVTPILVLTAKASTEDKVECLLDGADDYLTKPFVLEELLARIYALARRSAPASPNEVTFGDLKINLVDHSIASNGNEIALSQKEFQILELLLENSEGSVEKSEIMKKVWGQTEEGSCNSCEVYISFLRKKLDFIQSKVKIRALRALGYKLIKNENE